MTQLSVTLVDSLITVAEPAGAERALFAAEAGLDAFLAPALTRRDALDRAALAL